ncbi:hypothetical protein BDB00DRAFT_837985 [Zychaea mexicana]|uniref:uncharacterized protein n=1 Tax=Zychaea mexicana TaxID=64656 RepID=UPI0022FED82F|nr:uncharacterized protein BDB00DRAFT_837985 [Zychaea mexicana]KAI9490315.1 hypothetical protein BDB00DRAFT_837985 [Zychaea mexicana]
MARRNAPPPLTCLLQQQQQQQQQQRVPNTEPVSPGAISTASFMSSFSWVAEKSSAELTSLLKNAYSTLREKDRDLALAAEIGKSLLENNMCLKTRYENLLDQVNQCNQSLPSPSIDEGEAHDDKESRQQQQQQQCWDSAHGSQDEKDDDAEDYDNAMRLISNQNAREALIEALERKNAEMQMMLDNALNESSASTQANEKQMRKLNNEIELLQSNLDCAAQKIQELEEARNARQERAAALKRKDSSSSSSNDPYDANSARITPLYNMHDKENEWGAAEELAEKMMHMQSENQGLAHAKKLIEDKLETALSDLDTMRQQFHQFQFTRDGYENLQEAYQRQFKHIEELTTSLEEHRTILSRLRDRGIGWSPKPSPSPSEYGGVVFYGEQQRGGPLPPVAATPTTTSLSSCALQDLRMTTPKQSLLGELENAWLRSLQEQQNKPDDMVAPSPTATIDQDDDDDDEGHASNSDSDSCLSSSSPTPSVARKLRDVASLTEQNLASFYRAPAEYALETPVTSFSPPSPTPAGCFSKEPSMMIQEAAARYIKSTRSVHKGSSSSSARSVKSKSGSSIDFDLFSPGGSGSVYAAHDLYPRLSSELLFTSFDCRYYSNNNKGRRSPSTPKYYAPSSAVAAEHNSVELFHEVPSGLTGGAYWVLQCLFGALCQWCRFSLILMAAILINLWQGPEAIMEK